MLSLKELSVLLWGPTGDGAFCAVPEADAIRFS